MIVLDTNVISEAMKPQPDPRVASWIVLAIWRAMPFRLRRD
jgi:predicted nucleic acid-binding protein